MTQSQAGANARIWIRLCVGLSILGCTETTTIVIQGGEGLETLELTGMSPEGSERASALMEEMSILGDSTHYMLVFRDRPILGIDGSIRGPGGTLTSIFHNVNPDSNACTVWRDPEFGQIPFTQDAGDINPEGYCAPITLGRSLISVGASRAGEAQDGEHLDSGFVTQWGRVG